MKKYRDKNDNKRSENKQKQAYNLNACVQIIECKKEKN